MGVRSLVGVFLLVVTSAGSVISQQRLLYGTLQFGPYPVGFQVRHVYDYSRAYGERAERPIQIAIWYPSEKGTSHVAYSEYLGLYLTEETFGERNSQQKTDNLKFWSGLFRQLGDSLVDGDAVVAAQTVSVSDGKIAAGKFPVVLYGAGAEGEAFENSVLCEYLASYGYVVAASPSVGLLKSKISIDQVGLETQARDLEFILGFLHNFPAADAGRVGLMGWSWGGLAAMLVQARNPSIDALLSLDGSVALHEEKIRQTGFFTAQRLRVPSAFLSAGRTFNELKKFFDTVKYSKSYLLDFKGLEHGDFASYGYIARSISSGLDDAGKGKLRAYEVLCRFSRHFFDAFLKGSAESEHILSNEPRQFGMPDSLMTLLYKAPLPLPPTPEEFLSILQQEGIEKAKRVYDAARRNDSTYYFFSPDEMVEYAYILFDDYQRPNDALGAMKLCMDAHPTFYPAYGHLGRLYEKNKNFQSALEYFSKAYNMVSQRERNHDNELNMKYYERKIGQLKAKLNAGK